MNKLNVSALSAALIVIGLFAGCASKPVVWTKANSTTEEHEIAMGQCDAQAFTVSDSSLMQKNQVRHACMRGKGWKVGVN